MLHRDWFCHVCISYLVYVSCFYFQCRILHLLGFPSKNQQCYETLLAETKHYWNETANQPLRNKCLWWWGIHFESTGHLAVKDPGVCLSNHTLLSVMFTTSQLLTSTSKLSIKMPGFLPSPTPLAPPLLPPLAAHKPLAAPQDQTARLGPWLRLSIGSYGNGRLSPYCLIG